MSGIWLVALLAGLMFVPAFESDDTVAVIDDSTDPTDPVDPLADDTIEGTAGSDTITASGAQVVNGGEGDDRLFADTDANGAVLNGDAGDDTLTDGGENVTLNGGVGSDLFSGGAATGAVMNGGEGVDTFQLDGAGGVVVNAGAGDDVVSTLVDSQNMTINGGGGEDQFTVGGIGGTIHGDNGDDVINVEGAEAAVFGDAGNDTITASHGVRGGGTPLSGGEGDDMIILRDVTPELGAASTAASGDAGSDRFDVDVILGNGSRGVTDVLTGGADDDSFELSFIDEDNTSGGDLGVVSRITDFDQAEDALIIDLSDLDARLDDGEARSLAGITITEDVGATSVTLQFTGPTAEDAGSAVIQLDGVTGLEVDDITILGA